MSEYVWIVKRQSDTTEGRGPMMFDSVWADDREQVAQYIDDKPGVMGRTQKWSEEQHGDWTMERFPLFRDSVEIHEARQQELRQMALAKLSQEEMDALGIVDVWD